jgi:hypothetical protein
MWDLAPISIFINHLLYVSYLFLPNMGSGCYKLPPLNPGILVKATLCGAPVPHDRALVGGSDTICNDSEKSVSYICAITPKNISQFETFPKIHYKVQFHLVTK